MKFYLVQIGHIKGKDIVGLKQEFDVFAEIGADDLLQISGARQKVRH